MTEQAIDLRRQALQDWMRTCVGQDASDLTVVSGDASFRRYFRAQYRSDALQQRTIIAVDAPPEHENVVAFLTLADGLRRQGVNVPEVLYRDMARGFWLLQDFGDALFLPALNRATAPSLYGAAIDELIRLQKITTVDNYDLPEYNQARLHQEMQLFPDWFCVRHFQMTLSTQEQHLLETTFALLIDHALMQPQVLVHRDYHSRNLMLLSDSVRPGVIDFQDAVRGPITYDLVSLLKDCYIAWPRAQVLAFVELYLRKAESAGVLKCSDRESFLRWFDLMGLQRHIKVLGIFCRLNYRDGKASYLRDLPLVLRYCIEAAESYDELSEFAHWLRSRIAPHLNAHGGFVAS